MEHEEEHPGAILDVQPWVSEVQVDLTSGDQTLVKVACAVRSGASQSIQCVLPNMDILGVLIPWCLVLGDFVATNKPCNDGI